MELMSLWLSKALGKSAILCDRDISRGRGRLLRKGERQLTAIRGHETAQGCRELGKRRLVTIFAILSEKERV